MSIFPTRVVDFFLTYDCNSACPYCFVNQHGLKSSMSSETLEKSIDWIADTAKDEVEIVFIGGEPTLEPDKIEHTVQYATAVGAQKGVKFHFTMTTNFLNMDEALAQKLAAWKVSYLTSVDGYRERHDRSRPPRDKNIQSPFSLLEQRIQILKQYQPRMAARVTSTPFTVNWLSHDLQKLAEMGFGHFIISPATGIRWTDAKLQLYGDELAQFALQRAQKNGKPWPYISPLDDADKGKYQWGCGAGRGRVAISPHGNIHACARFTGMTSGDRLPFGDIHNGITTEDNIIKFQDNSYQSRMECLTCPIREECLGGCPAVNWEETGSLVTPSVNECRMMKTTIAVKRRVHAGNEPSKENRHG
ncbi:MAG: SPASM domain-containing protein [Gammaproteobacteria bacterium]|nr:SPASM domain-containing protein [Gammaproteobacteria bacterium]MBU1725215.1 SPASM domain-containing protein [Gammaproteobacteria bacterium]MBU2005666.1 SPASM domain-containing protein [Gammaproteobacteria bacterium]